MKKEVILVCFLVLWQILVSCGDFLEEFSLDKVYAEDCNDLDELLIGDGYMTPSSSRPNIYAFSAKDYYYPFLYIMDDDVNESVVGNLDLSSSNVVNRIFRYRHVYTWQAEPYTDMEGKAYSDDPTFEKLYKHIGVVNVIISYIDEFKDDPEEIRNRLLGECLTLRGIYYYLLANIYGLPYVEATSNADLCVPLKTTEYIDDRHWARNSTGEVYKQIVEDLTRGADYLKGIEQSSFYRIDERAARLILSRVYLYMGKWELALGEINKILDLGISLTDLRTEVSVPSRGDYTTVDAWFRARAYFLEADTKELLFTMGSPTMALMMMNNTSQALNYQVSTDLLNSYAEGDLRFEKFFFEQFPGHYVSVKVPHAGAVLDRIKVFDSFILRGAEVYLNKAEAEVMTGDEGSAKQTLKTLLEHRYEAGKLPDVDSYNGEELMGLIREERRKEFCFESQRWFDLRRYAVSPKYPEERSIRHAVYYAGVSAGSDGAVEGYYELKPYSQDKAWVMPFPESEILFNDGSLIDNLRDKREMLK